MNAKQVRIQHKIFGDSEGWVKNKDLHVTTIETAMDAYGKQQAIEFQNWVDKSEIVYDDIAKCYVKDDAFFCDTVDQLYDLYLTHKNKSDVKPEELLQKRYKIIAEDTSGNLKVGQVLVHDEEANVFWCGKTCFTEDQLKSLHHLFQPLPWYACRKVNDMPRYVKWAQSNPVQVAEVVQWDMEGAMFPTCLIKGECHMRCVVECDLLPATFDEYITYIKR